MSEETPGHFRAFNILWSELDLVYGPDSDIKAFYGREPGRKLDRVLESILQRFSLSANVQATVRAKLTNQCRKLYMFHLAGTKTLEWEAEFISTQDRTSPTLIWENEIEFLYHLEAMILFGRSALDLGAYLYSRFLLQPLGEKRLDSFNDFSKEILKSDEEVLSILRQTLREAEDQEASWYRVLCGTSKGRSLRDQIVHQTIVRIEYFETSPNSEKEYCHVVLSNDTAIPLEAFVNQLRKDVFAFCLHAEDTIVQTLT